MVLKRKQSAHSVCIEKKKVILPRKPPNKADLVEEIKLIKKLNDAMEEEIKDSDDKIAILEEREKKNLEAIKELQKIDRCRLYLQVETLSDITDGTGDYISITSYNGKRTNFTTPTHDWPEQTIPDKSHWNLWKKAI